MLYFGFERVSEAKGGTQQREYSEGEGSLVSGHVAVAHKAKPTSAGAHVQIAVIRREYSLHPKLTHIDPVMPASIETRICSFSPSCGAHSSRKRQSPCSRVCAQSRTHRARISPRTLLPLSFSLCI